VTVLRYDTASTTHRVSSSSMVLRVRRQPWEFAHGVTFSIFAKVLHFQRSQQRSLNV
jgi:hypothetical protein